MTSVAASFEEEEWVTTGGDQTFCSNSSARISDVPERLSAVRSVSEPPSKEIKQFATDLAAGGISGILAATSCDGEEPVSTGGDRTCCSNTSIPEWLSAVRSGWDPLSGDSSVVIGSLDCREGECMLADGEAEAAGREMKRRLNEERSGARRGSCPGVKRTKEGPGEGGTRARVSSEFMTVGV